MTSYRKTRGVDTSGGEPTDHERQRAQWGMATASRVLECMFPETSLDDGNSVCTNSLLSYTKYNAESLARRAREYFINIYDTNLSGVSIIPDIEDFCLFAHISRVTFIQYCSGHDLDLANVANNVKTAIAACKKQMAMDGQIPPVVFAIDFNNNHDYIQQKYQVEMHTTAEIDIQDNIDDIASRLPVSSSEKLIETEE